MLQNGVGWMTKRSSGPTRSGRPMLSSDIGPPRSGSVRTSTSIPDIPGSGPERKTSVVPPVPPVGPVGPAVHRQLCQLGHAANWKASAEVSVTDSAVWTCLRISAIRSPIDGRLTAVVERLGEPWAGWTASVAEATTMLPTPAFTSPWRWLRSCPRSEGACDSICLSPGWWAGL